MPIGKGEHIKDTHQVPPARTISAGNGLTGGGTLDANRTVTLDTPSTVTNSTTNSVTASSHTHALTVTKSDVGLSDVENKTAATIRTETGQIRTEVVSSFPAHSNGRIIAHTGNKKAYVSIGGEWV